MSQTTIANGKTVLLDTVVLIYFLENNPKFGRAARNQLERIESGSINGIISTLLFTELLVRPFSINDQQAVSGVVTRLSNFHNLTICDVDRQTGITAARLRAKFAIRTPDAIHAATALESGADGILTNDRQLRRLEEENLSVWLIDELA